MGWLILGLVLGFMAVKIGDLSPHKPRCQAHQTYSEVMMECRKN